MPDFGSSTFSQVDANNNSGTQPSWSGSAAPSTLDDAGRALQGANTREWNWRNYTLTAAGTADAKTLTYSVAPAAYYNGQRFAFIANTTNTTTCTLNVNSLGAKTIKSMLTGTLANLAASDMVAGMYCEVAYNTANDCFVWVNQKTPSSALPVADASTSGIVELATTTEVLTGTDATRAVTPDSLAALWEQGADVASAGTISLGEGGYFNITGTTTITDIDLATDKAGRSAKVKFAGILTLTHNASTLILPGGSSITTAAGDTAEFISEGADAVRCISYTRASGLPVVSPSAGGFTLLGTISISGAVSGNISGLTLTSYKMIHVAGAAAYDVGSSSDYYLIGNSTADDVQCSATQGATSAGIPLFVMLSLDNGVGIGLGCNVDGTSAQWAFKCPLTTASTTISIASSGASFTGSFNVYGVK